MIFQTYSEEETKDVGRKLAKTARAGEVYALEGGLGAGKTAFVKGFAEGLGIEEPVSSPTFTILQQYDGGRLLLYHFDVYRIADPLEIEAVGLDEYFGGEGVCLIEWAGLIEELLPPDCIRIRIDKDLSMDPDYRRIEIEDPAERRSDEHSRN